MEEETNIEITEPTCSICKTPMSLEDVYCPECGFPEKGTEKEVAQFHARNAMQRNQHMDADKKIKSARNVLYVMAGIILLFGFINFFRDQDVALLISSVVIGVVYLVLGSWTSKKPMVAILLGLLLYITSIIINVVMIGPEMILKGIIFKIIIIAYLAKGVYSASSIKK